MNPDDYLPMSEITQDTYRDSSPSSRHFGIRLTHNPTGVRIAVRWVGGDWRIGKQKLDEARMKLTIAVEEKDNWQHSGKTL